MTRFADCSVDDTIVERARFGDLDAHEHMYRTFSTPVHNLALRLTRQPAVAEEILQDTFIEVLTKIESFRSEAPIGAWIREITVNKCLMHLRSGWQQKFRPLDSMLSMHESLETDFNERPLSEAVSDRMDLEKAFDMLPHMGRTVVWLHDVEGYTHNEIGKLMGKSTSFSKSQLARAHKRLQVLLEPASKLKIFSSGEARAFRKAQFTR